MNEKKREQQITRTSIIGILANIMLVAFKAVVGLIAGSISVILDAVNNLTDAMSSVITIVGIKLSKRKPDKKHPFGYGRIEYFSAIVISIIVLSAGVTSLIESAKRIFSPKLADYSLISVVVISVAVIVKILLGLYVKNQGNKYNSDALTASGSDALFDAIISSSTLIGAIVTMLFNITLDGIISAVISLFIIKAGIEMLLKPVGSMIGARPDAEITREIKSEINGIEGVIGAYDLILHNYGPDYAIGSVHVEIDADMNARDIHKLTQTIQNAIIKKFHVFLTVGLYAIDNKYNDIRKMIHEIAIKHEGVLATHGIYVDEENGLISFDVLADFTVHDKQELLKEIELQVKESLPEYKTVKINFDTDFSN